MKQFTEGDIFYTFYDKQFHIYKLLKANSHTYHTLRYASVDELPDPADIASLEVFFYHAPIAISGFKNPKLLAKSTLTDDDMIGYYEYLRQINDVEELTDIANNYAQKAYDLTGLERYEEAIQCYSRAIDLLPDFFEAIENRAFCKMELGRWEEAIEDFRLSLTLNPEILPAVFSIGECLLNKGDYTDAIIQFEKVLEIDPDHQLSKEYLKKAIMGNKQDE